MSIFKINPTDYQTVSVATRPSRYYSSSSFEGVTGSIFVFPRRSTIEKEITVATKEDDGWFNDASLEDEFKKVYNAYLQPNNTNILTSFETLLNKINLQNVSTRKSKLLNINRFLPFPVVDDNDNLSQEFYKKSLIREVLTPYYKTCYRNCGWGYVNYNSLNFFSASDGNDSPAIVYPNYESGVVHDGYETGIYTPSGSFSLDFHINPRYNYLDEQGHFRAGTIFHLSSSYSLSLVTGSLKDANGLPVGFNLVLQLSHSADVSPSMAVHGPYPNNLIFSSKDNALSYNKWHRVVVRWGTDAINQGTGSFVVDGIEAGNFNIPSGTIAPRKYPVSEGFDDPAGPDALFVGNFYEGTNRNNNKLRRFFTHPASGSYGCYEIPQTSPSMTVAPDNFSCTHPFRGELHHLAIRMKYMSDADIKIPSLGMTKETVFYLPPYFKEETPIRNYTVHPGSGVPETVSQNFSFTTVDPFSTHLAFGTNGHYINIENYLADFVNPVFLPRLVNLTHTSVATQIPDYSANDHLYDQHEVRARNLLILPCDDGNYSPTYDVLKNEVFKNLYVDDEGNENISYVNLSNMIVADDVLNKLSNPVELSFNDLELDLLATPYSIYNMGGFYSNFANAADAAADETRENINIVARKPPLSVAERTKDTSSNQVTFFDVSNLFYGINISPNTFVLSDSSITGSNGKIRITIKDDGAGGLYRADCSTTPAAWNTVGTIFYNEGIIAIKNPHLYFFGKEQFEMSFKGEQNVHVLRFDVMAPSNHLISSSNPSFIDVPSTNRPNEPDSKFVYITGINFHDDNLNVVMKTQLAQPIMKRHSDKIAFKVKYDW